MKDSVNAVAVQYASTWLDTAANATRMADIIANEGKRGTELVVFPELSSSGYFSPALRGFDPEFARSYYDCADTIPGHTTGQLAEACKDCGVYAAVGILERDANVPTTLYNAMALIGPEGLVGVYRKVHLPGEEKRYFRAGTAIPAFATPLGVIGLSICYDGRFPELTRVLTLRGCEIICSGWALMEVPELVAVDESIMFRAYTRAQENSVYYIAANRSGVEGETVFIGHSCVAAPNGEIVASSSSRDEEIVRAELRAERVTGFRQILTTLNDRRPELYQDVVAPAAPR